MESNYLMMGLLEGFFFYIFLTENDENATVFNFIRDVVYHFVYNFSFSMIR